MAGTLVADTLQDGAGNSTSMDNAIYGSAKAWALFDGSQSSPITPTASYNVSSITKNSTGNFTANFTNALTNNNYCFIGNASDNSTGDFRQIGFWNNTSSSAVNFISMYVSSTGGSGTAYDCQKTTFAVFK